MNTKVPTLGSDPWEHESVRPPDRVRVGDWMCTYTGRKFYPLDPHPYDVDIRDIAHALSSLCRFGGHCREFYSVAQHSVLVSYAVQDRALRLWGLLHDAAEAYVGDVVWPLKRSTLLDGHRVIEDRVMRAVAIHFGLTMPEPPEVKAADLVALSTEKRDLMAPKQEGRQRDTGVELAAAAHAGRVPWSTDVTPLDETIDPWPPAIAEARFLERFGELTR